MHLPALNNFIQRLITSLILAALLAGTFFYAAPFYSSLLLAIIWLLIMVFEWPHLFYTVPAPIKLIALLYPTVSFEFLILMNNDPCYRQLLPILFTIVFSFDTGAYIFGKLFGQHPLWPKISRNKTWEGVSGGYFFAAIIFMILFWSDVFNLMNIIMPSIGFINRLILGTCFCALVGDLFESFLKRRVGLKDSGNLLPGHGGLLDRFDSIICAAILFYVLRDYLVHAFDICF